MSISAKFFVITAAIAVVWFLDPVSPDDEKGKSPRKCEDNVPSDGGTLTLSEMLPLQIQKWVELAEQVRLHGTNDGGDPYCFVDRDRGRECVDWRSYDEGYWPRDNSCTDERCTCDTNLCNGPELRPKRRKKGLTCNICRGSAQIPPAATGRWATSGDYYNKLLASDDCSNFTENKTPSSQTRFNPRLFLDLVIFKESNFLEAIFTPAVANFGRHKFANTLKPFCYLHKTHGRGCSIENSTAFFLDDLPAFVGQCNDYGCKCDDADLCNGDPLLGKKNDTVETTVVERRNTANEVKSSTGFGVITTLMGVSHVVGRRYFAGFCKLVLLIIDLLPVRVSSTPPFRDLDADRKWTTSPIRRWQSLPNSSSSWSPAPSQSCFWTTSPPRRGIRMLHLHDPFNIKLDEDWDDGDRKEEVRKYNEKAMASGDCLEFSENTQDNPKRRVKCPDYWEIPRCYVDRERGRGCSRYADWPANSCTEEKCTCDTELCNGPELRPNRREKGLKCKVCRGSVPIPAAATGRWTTGDEYYRTLIKSENCSGFDDHHDNDQSCTCDTADLCNGPELRPKRRRKDRALTCNVCWGKVELPGATGRWASVPDYRQKLMASEDCSKFNEKEQRRWKWQAQCPDDWKNPYCYIHKRYGGGCDDKNSSSFVLEDLPDFVGQCNDVGCKCDDADLCNAPLLLGERMVQKNNGNDVHGLITQINFAQFKAWISNNYQTTMPTNGETNILLGYV
ncbi:hypothetical protein Fcan01_18878 [Folsomia candida]|uniref:Uncharacterized protein n=1 Tax=Folsomia candida TaxID=158441 RepID=A0A226DMU1_FOLCA|nr:hypothetical protein Fcan01_18878 [Folsomia candida]